MALRRGHGVWRNKIWDAGAGIAREHQQTIFQGFYRIPLRGTEEGFGLGLAIVSRMSHALGCPVRLASRVGRGSIFSVELHPAVQPGN